MLTILAFVGHPVNILSIAEVGYLFKNLKNAAGGSNLQGKFVQDKI